jgi:hypothetical protein
MDKSAVLEHSISMGHCIVREAIEIELLPNNMNREDYFCLSKSWKPLICSLKDCRKPPSHDGGTGFSAGPHRSVHTGRIRTQTVPSPGIDQPLS